MKAWYIVLAVAVVVFLFLRRKKAGRAEKRPSRPEKSFEERHGELPCDGLKCSVNDACSEAERLFCRDVLSKAIPNGFYSSQHIVCPPSGIRKIDFAFRTADGQKVAIELDGYGPHVAHLTRDKFDEQLQRQNELVIDGWKVLRFSFDQCVNRKSDCIEAIKKLLGKNTQNVRAFPAVFHDVFYPYEEGQPAIGTLKAAGALWSDRRERWYFPAKQEAKVPLPSHWKLTPWSVCPMCGEKSYLSGAQWQCKSCSERFEIPDIA